MNDTSDRRYLAIKSLMSPRHTHSHGMILDSVVLSFIDEAGAVGARHESRRSGWPDQPMVAIDFKNVESHQAVFVGDLLSFYTRVMAVDRTSITVHVTVETDREGKVEQIADAEVTYETVKLEEQDRQPVLIRGEC